MMVVIVLVVLVSLMVLCGARARDFLLRRPAGGSERHGRQLQQGREGE